MRVREKMVRVRVGKREEGEGEEGEDRGNTLSKYGNKIP